jgi:hypothetical protein
MSLSMEEARLLKFLYVRGTKQIMDRELYAYNHSHATVLILKQRGFILIINRGMYYDFEISTLGRRVMTDIKRKSKEVRKYEHEDKWGYMLRLSALVKLHV